MLHLANESRFDTLGPLGSEGACDMAKVRALGEGSKHDICVSSASSRTPKGTQRLGDVASGGVCHSFSHDGRCVSLFKTLYTNSCVHECGYCPNASTCVSHSGDYAYTPEELARLTVQLYRGNYIEGLFLSSGIGSDVDDIMEGMIESVRILRTRYAFQGYVHLKVLPGASKEHIKQCLELADRVSVNIETVSPSRMDELSTSKDYVNDILRRQRYICTLQRHIPLPAGQTTQMIVGGAHERDDEIFSASIKEYRRYSVRRVYYSAFTPVEGTLLEREKMQPRWREHRLYQLDWLYRVYKLPLEELFAIFDDEGALTNRDPKFELARLVLDRPVDPNVATYEDLLHVPGIGPITASRIIRARESQQIVSRRQLHLLGVRMKHASPFLLINGWGECTLDRWTS